MACAEAEVVIEAHLDSRSFGTWVAAMLGDPGAHAGGWTPLGLPSRAGDAVAIDRYYAAE